MKKWIIRGDADRNAEDGGGSALSRRRPAFVWLLNSLCLLAGAFAVGTAVAQQVPNCMEDEVDRVGGNVGTPLNCTSEDVRLARYDVIAGPTECVAGDEINVTLQLNAIAGSKLRYDPGIFIALDGGNALRGQCHRDWLSPTDTTTIPTVGGVRTAPFYNAEAAGDPNDVCGDVEQGVINKLDIEPLTLVCQDSDGDGFADVASCTSWDNNASDGSKNKPSCTSQLDTLPNTKAKCKCGAVPIGNIAVRGAIIVDKVTIPPGDSTRFDFTLTAPNPNDGSSFDLSDQDAPWESDPLVAGTYQVTETGPPDGWNLTSASCTNNKGTPDNPDDDETFDYTNGGNIVLGAEEVVTCTFENTQSAELVCCLSLRSDGRVAQNSDQSGPAEVMFGTGAFIATTNDFGQTYELDLKSGMGEGFFENGLVYNNGFFESDAPKGNWPVEYFPTQTPDPFLVDFGVGSEVPPTGGPEAVCPTFEGKLDGTLETTGTGGSNTGAVISFTDPNKTYTYTPGTFVGHAGSYKVRACIPEPGSLALMLLPLAGLGLARRVRRRESFRTAAAARY